MESDGWLVSWCLGHLVEQVPPEGYDPRYAKWSREDLPIIPRKWKFRVVPATKKQYDVVTALMNDERVSTIVAATDAGREGELIFRLIYNQCGCGKPVKRLWLSSMEESGIREGLKNLRDSAEFDSLYQAALCRAKADWLVGFNCTRFFTTLYRGKTLNVGRVMTPTLALLTEREAAIEGFQKEKFYTVELDLHSFRAVSERLADREEADRLCAACDRNTAIVQSVERQEKAERPPKLYDLTTLQREANRLFGLTAQQTLDRLQSLYEKRLATYPRTDSRYLTEDMTPGLPDLCGKVAAALPFFTDATPCVNAGQVVDNGKVSDHHAIIPTREIAKADLSTLTPDEQNILHMIAVRLLCAVGEPYQYAETAVTLNCGGASFSAKGRTTISEGWKATEKAFRNTLKRDKKCGKDQEPPQPLPSLDKGQSIDNAGAAVKEGTTKPPSHFTEDTLLAAMEHASAEDFAKIKDLERTGLGTPATRAEILEKLIKSGFMTRKNRQLLPTEEGRELIRVLPESLCSAGLTAEWEEKLSQIQRGELDPDTFLSGIEAMITGLIHGYDGVTVDTAPLFQPDRPVVGRCPRCGRNVVEGKQSFSCEGYYDGKSCPFALWKNDRFFTGKGKRVTKRVAEALLRDGRVHMTKLHSAKKGTDYDATVVMDAAADEKYVRFRLEFDRK